MFPASCDSSLAAPCDSKCINGTLLWHHACRCIRQWLVGFSNTCPTCRAIVITSPTAVGSPPRPEAPDALMPANTAGAAQPASQSQLQDGRSSLDAEDVTVCPPPPHAASATTSAAGASSPSGGTSIISTNRIVTSILAELCTALSLPTPPLALSLGPRAGLGIGSWDPGPGPGEDGDGAANTLGDTPLIAQQPSEGVELSVDEDAEERGLTLDCGSAGGCEDAGCASANTLDDPTYRKLQLMFRYTDSLMPACPPLCFIVKGDGAPSPLHLLFLCICCFLTHVDATGVTLGRRARQPRRPWRGGWP